MESFKDYAVCFYSYDMKERAPKFLPCGHNLCSQCLMKTLNKPLLRKCPSDNHAFAYHQNALDSFPPNFVLLEYLEREYMQKSS